MNSEKEIGEIVRKLRGETSLRDFAEKCKMSHTTIDNIEKGFDYRTGKIVQVKLSTLDKIATTCGVSLSYILGIENETPIKNNNPQIQEIIDLCNQMDEVNQKTILNMLKLINSQKNN